MEKIIYEKSKFVREEHEFKIEERMGSRIREIRREILHCHNKVIRDIYKSHIVYLQECGGNC